ncbi:hypothetical protein DY245_32405 [Streptomyces inhibens]|uniref:Uncharacterized protein n=1 Tax=Streptomyces inhibens TaxID=2293571 RepID=A0A371PWC8_STRIH|nr:hypothetical protein [Streptomyces inhibens]REK86463.1 hypothetical protein DY245_32405 [Streptomyces inhibens]
MRQPPPAPTSLPPHFLRRAAPRLPGTAACALVLQPQRAGATLTQARDALDAYLVEHPDISEEADVMVSNAMAEEAIANFARGPHGAPPPGEHPDADQHD